MVWFFKSVASLVLFLFSKKLAFDSYAARGSFVPRVTEGGTVSWGTNINEVCAKTCNACGDDASDAVTDEDAEPANFGGGECAIAPGPMGAAHQLVSNVVPALC